MPVDDPVDVPVRGPDGRDAATAGELLAEVPVVVLDDPVGLPDVEGLYSRRPANLTGGPGTCAFDSCVSGCVVCEVCVSSAADNIAVLAPGRDLPCPGVAPLSEVSDCARVGEVLRKSAVALALCL